MQPLPGGRGAHAAHEQSQKCVESGRKEIEHETGSREGPDMGQEERRARGGQADWARASADRGGQPGEAKVGRTGPRGMFK